MNNENLQLNLNICTSFHPQIDGQSESAFQTIEWMLRCFVTCTQENRTKLLLGLEFVPEQLCKWKNFSPFHTTHGQPPFQRSDIIDSNIQKTWKNQKIMLFFQKITYASKFAETSIERLYESIWDRHKSVDPNFKVGYQELFSAKKWRCLPKNKLVQKFSGPLFVTYGFFQICLYLLELLPQVNHIRNKFQISLLNRCMPRKCREGTILLTKIVKNTENILSHRNWKSQKEIFIQFL